MNFLDIEKDFVRQKLLPDFELTGFELATEPNPITKTVKEAH